jgi:hypothetical protein
MDMGLAAIVVALISTIGGIVVGFMQSFKKETLSTRTENRLDHAVVQAQLRMLHKSVDRVGDRLETHIDGHGEGGYGKITGTNPN